ncbi:hypothetical protein Micbo1qcDRAFT_175203 [Microdochium bolleyi]|uniref:Uncharacterized protein n=1 Tax=Microdochium bolleyi TaxID=196109 RepID=A0A136J4W1_9PEZI|nr:hypothetical protein Micbo1qcDRAFT_175203 [Microdochium bolleyi]
MSSTGSGPDSLKQISLYAALSEGNVFPKFDGQKKRAPDSNWSPPPDKTPLCARSRDKETYLKHLDDFLGNGDVKKRLEKVWMFDSINYYVENEASVTAVANLMIVDVATKVLLAFIDTLKADERAVLGDGFKIIPQNYISHTGGNNVYLDLLFVRVFKNEKVPRKNSNFLLIEFKAHGLLGAESFNKICSNDEAIPKRTLFRNDAAQHVAQISSYAIKAHCTVAALMDMTHVEVFWFDKMHEGPGGSKNMLVIGETCERTVFTEINNHRRAVAGLILAAFKNTAGPRPFVPPTQPPSTVESNAAGATSLTIPIRRSARINSAAPSRAHSPQSDFTEDRASDTGGSDTGDSAAAGTKAAGTKAAGTKAAGTKAASTKAAGTKATPKAGGSSTRS